MIKNIVLWGTMIAALSVRPVVALHYNALQLLVASVGGIGVMYGGYRVYKNYRDNYSHRLSIQQPTIIKSSSITHDIALSSLQPTFKNFQDAIVNGDSEKFYALLRAVQDPACGVSLKDLVSERGTTLLMQAAGAGNAECVNACIRCGIGVNAVDHYGKTALMAAVYVKSFEVVSRLLECGALTDHRDCDGNTAFMYALKTKAPADITRQLLKRNPLLEICNSDGKSPLMLATEAQSHSDILVEITRRCDGKMIIKQGDNSGRTPLMIFAQQGKIDMMKLLCACNTDTQRQDGQGRNVIDYALEHAICNRKPQFLTQLQAVGISIKERGHDNLGYYINTMKQCGDSRYRAYADAMKSIQLLIAHGANPDCGEPSARKQAQGHPEILKLLGGKPCSPLPSRL